MPLNIAGSSAARGGALNSTRIIVRAQGKCEICGCRPVKQVHHRKYSKTPADTPDSELQAVCGVCHMKAHR
jgi:hypothetical protein